MPKQSATMFQRFNTYMHTYNTAKMLSVESAGMAFSFRLVQSVFVVLALVYLFGMHAYMEVEEPNAFVPVQVFNEKTLKEFMDTSTMARLLAAANVSTTLTAPPSGGEFCVDNTRDIAYLARDTKEEVIIGCDIKTDTQQYEDSPNSVKIPTTIYTEHICQVDTDSDSDGDAYCPSSVEFISGVEDLYIAFPARWTTSWEAEGVIDFAFVEDMDALVEYELVAHRGVYFLPLATILELGSIQLDAVNKYSGFGQLHALRMGKLGYDPSFRLTGVSFRIELGYTNFRSGSPMDFTTELRVRVVPTSAGMWSRLRDYYSTAADGAVSHTTFYGIELLLRPTGTIGRPSAAMFLQGLVVCVILVTIASQIMDSVAELVSPTFVRQKYQDPSSTATLEEMVEMFEEDGMLGRSALSLPDGRPVEEVVFKVKKDIDALRDLYKVETQLLRQEVVKIGQMAGANTTENKLFTLELSTAENLGVETNGKGDNGHGDPLPLTEGDYANLEAGGPYKMALLSNNDASVLELKDGVTDIGRGFGDNNDKRIASKQISIDANPNTGYILVKAASKSRGQPGYHAPEAGGYWKQLPLSVDKPIRLVNKCKLTMLMPEDPSVDPPNECIVQISLQPLSGAADPAKKMWIPPLGF